MTNGQLALMCIAVAGLVLRWLTTEAERVEALRQLMSVQRERDSLYAVVNGLERDNVSLRNRLREFERQRAVRSLGGSA